DRPELRRQRPGRHGRHREDLQDGRREDPRHAVGAADPAPHPRGGARAGRARHPLQRGGDAAVSRVRIAAASFLNSRPLLHGLGRGPARERIVVEHAPPSECARRLAEGEADVGLLPVAAIAQLGLYALPVGCVSSKGPVESVILVGETPLDSWKTVLLDRSSRTSVVVTRILLDARGKKDVRYQVRDPDEAARLVGPEQGALLIGDTALMLADRFPYRYDLAEMWASW